MNGGFHRKRLSERDLKGDAALAVVVRAVNRLAEAVEARTPLGLAGGLLRQSAGGFTLRGGGGVGGGGGGLLPPLYATGGRGEIRVEPGWVYGDAGLAVMPRLRGRLLSEGPALSVGRNANGWLLLRVQVRVETEMIVVGGEELEVVTAWEVAAAGFRFQGDSPEVLNGGVLAAPKLVQVDVLAAKVRRGQVLPVLATDLMVEGVRVGVTWTDEVGPSTLPNVASPGWVRVRTAGFRPSVTVLG